MSVKKVIHLFFKKFGLRVSRVNRESAADIIPEYTDQQKIAGNGEPIIFDVGAHHGQTALLYHELFKQATIFSFEPFADSFENLEKATKDIPDIRVFNTALSDKTGKAIFHINGSTQTNSILPTDEKGDATWGAGLLNTVNTVEVDTMRIDDFMQIHQIKKIDILKLDTQGSEYAVIEGASEMIRQNRVSMIYTEIITMPTYEGQKYFDELLFLLRTKGFTLYNLYNLSHTTKGALRQVDAIFIHNSFKPNN